MDPMPHAAMLANHSLTDERIRFFDENGYLALRGLVTGELLERLQKAAANWIDEGKRLGPGAEDHVWAKREGGEALFRIDYLHDKGERASLELLGAPQILGAVQSLLGPNFVPTYEAMVFKEQGDGQPIRWHQDVVHPRRHRIFNLDLYLDPSVSGAGALMVLPGSQTERLDACELERLHGWAPPGAIEVEMQPGDVLIHDVMVVHGSPRSVGKARRRTIYYEFRPAEQILQEGPWDRSWVDRRLRLIPLGLRAHGERFPDESPFVWQPDPEFRQAVEGTYEEELKIGHVVHTGGAYCSASSAPA